MPFSQGPRACLGRKFSETESVAVLCAVVLRYRVAVADEARFEGESAEERVRRVLASKPGVTMTCVLFYLFVLCAARGC